MATSDTGDTGNTGDEGDYAARLQAILGGQLGPATAEGGRRVLYRCPACGLPWLQDGPRAPRLRLAGEELAAIARELAADIGALPYATCRICGAQGIGEIDLDAYGAGAGGYGLSWEGVQPAGAHLLCVCMRLDWLGRARMPSDTRAGVVTRFDHCRAWLGWVQRLRTPEQYRQIGPADSAEMARSNPPGHRAPGTEDWRWRGAVWQGPCPPLGGRCYLSFAQAVPPGEGFSLANMFAAWRAIASIVLAGKIAGETEG